MVVVRLLMRKSREVGLDGSSRQRQHPLSTVTLRTGLLLTVLRRQM